MQVYVNLGHCRSLNLCLIGVRRFCVRYDIDFRQLARGEVPVEEVEATGQGYALQVAKEARRDASGR